MSTSFFFGTLTLRKLTYFYQGEKKGKFQPELADVAIYFLFIFF